MQSPDQLPRTDADASAAFKGTGVLPIGYDLNPSMQSILVADEIRCRLFDHRQFTGGEVRFIAKEFEEKRDWKEAQGLLTSQASAVELKALSCKTIDNLTDSRVPQTFSKGNFQIQAFASLSLFTFLKHLVDCLLNMASRILDKEKTADERRQERIHERREDIKSDMKVFEEEMQKKKVAIDESFLEKEQEIQTHYYNLEKSLKKDVYTNTRPGSISEPAE